jgi:hypothetical protein
MKAILGIVVIAVSMAGCAHDFAEIKRSQLNQAFVVNSSPTFLGYDYLGSDASYHYFVAKWKYGTDERFKVHTSDLVVDKPTSVGTLAVQVVVFPGELTTPEYEEFGRIGHQTLWRKK